MRIILELENSSKLHLLLEFLKDLRYVRSVDILENDMPITSIQTALSKEEALEIVQAGCEMASFGDPVEFQKQQRSDRILLLG